ncbi:MAG: ThiF family adenylyltransferase [Patescibacteria group bacterium]
MSDLQLRYYNFRGKNKKMFDAFLQKYADYTQYDYYAPAATELRALRALTLSQQKKADSENDSLAQSPAKNSTGKDFQLGTWIVNQETKMLFHLLDQAEYLELRTNRNRGLITIAEQHKLYDVKVGVIGLSVGSQLALNAARMGIGKSFILADFDTVEITNLNRTPYFLSDIGKPKVSVIAQQMLQVDPYLKIDCIQKQMSTTELEKVVESVDIIVDAFDDFEKKVFLRKVARSRKIPVVSGYDVDRGALLIVERYDTENVSEKIFLHAASNESLLKKSGSPEDKIKKFMDLIGIENHSQRMLDVVNKLGIEYAGIPQLLPTGQLLCSLWTLSIIDIILGTTKKSLRSFVVNE